MQTCLVSLLRLHEHVEKKKKKKKKKKNKLLELIQSNPEQLGQNISIYVCFSAEQLGMVGRHNILFYGVAGDSRLSIANIR